MLRKVKTERDRQNRTVTGTIRDTHGTRTVQFACQARFIFACDDSVLTGAVQFCLPRFRLCLSKAPPSGRRECFRAFSV